MLKYIYTKEEALTDFRYAYNYWYPKRQSDSKVLLAHTNETSIGANSQNDR
jgi:hypothetical protein